MESVRLCRVALANYFGAALLMPYDEFLRCAEEMRYDVELLQHHFTASWEQVCHRLTTMSKPEAMTPFVPNLRRSVILPQAGHWTQQERPREVNEELITFLNGL